MKRNDVEQHGSTTDPGPWDDGPVIPRIPRPRPPHPGSLAEGAGWQSKPGGGGPGRGGDHVSATHQGLAARALTEQTRQHLAAAKAAAEAARRASEAAGLAARQSRPTVSERPAHTTGDVSGTIQPTSGAETGPGQIDRDEVSPGSDAERAGGRRDRRGQRP